MSAPETAPAEPPAVGTASWQEEDYITALARLEDVQNQLGTVRLIPRHFVQSLASPPKGPGSPETVGNHLQRFQAVMRQAAQDIETLKVTWEDKRTETIVQQARLGATTSEGEFPTTEEVPLYGWREKAKVLPVKSRLFGDAVLSQKSDEVVEEMKQEFVKLEWVDEEHTQLEASIKSKSAVSKPIALNFTIALDGGVLHVTCPGKHLLTSVLAKRPHQNDLKYLLVCYKNPIDPTHR